MKHTQFFTVRFSVAARAMAVVAFAAALGGCGGSAPLFTGDGRVTTQVQCSSAGPWDTCLQNARGICQGDFDVIQQSSSGDTRTLLFACRAK
ncbi:hypothetical protein AAHK20_13660 [Trinickia sp. YCB016]